MKAMVIDNLFPTVVVGPSDEMFKAISVEKQLQTINNLCEHLGTKVIEVETLQEASKVIEDLLDGVYYERLEHDAMMECWHDDWGCGD